MALVTVCSPVGAGCATTTAVFLAGTISAERRVLLAECDPSGGDLAAWGQLPLAPGWASAVAGRARTLDGVVGHAQLLPSGIAAVVAPARPIAAAMVIAAAASTFGQVVAADHDAIVVADCGRVGSSPSPWVEHAALTLLVVRQNRVAAAPNVALLDRSLEALDVLGATARKVGVVLVGDRPYPPAEIEQVLGTPLFALLPDDPHGAAIALGGWTLARRAGRTGLARAAATLAARVVDVVAPANSRPALAADLGTVAATATAGRDDVGTAHVAGYAGVDGEQVR